MAMCPKFLIVPSESGYMDDLFCFKPRTLEWMRLSTVGARPTPRYDVGFTATPDGKIYLFGGYSCYNCCKNKLNLGKLLALYHEWSGKQDHN